MPDIVGDQTKQVLIGRTAAPGPLVPSRERLQRACRGAGGRVYRRGMSFHAALEHVWMRALVACATYLTVFFGLVALASDAFAHGDGTVGAPVVLFDVLSVAVTIGPAWVYQPRTRPPGGPPPRGGIVPLPVRTPEQADGTGDDQAPPAAA